MSTSIRAHKVRAQYRSFGILPGLHVDLVKPAGYHLDMSVKATAPDWPPIWVPADSRRTAWVALAQFALGALERHTSGQGDAWLQVARKAGDHLTEHQERGGPLDGAWRFPDPVGHTYHVGPDWISAMAQGEAASVLARLGMLTGAERYLDAAVRAIGPYNVTVADGGVRTGLNDGVWFEEYPTARPSCVLNGGIFALWGLYDVACATGDPATRELWQAGVTTLADNIDCWDLGYWSGYDLFPHPVPHAASEAYHALHTLQLAATLRLHPDPRLHAAHERFAAYGTSRSGRARGVLGKVIFRLAVPRNPWFAHRLPWREPERDVRGSQRSKT